MQGLPPHQQSPLCRCPTFGNAARSTNVCNAEAAPRRSTRLRATTRCALQDSAKPAFCAPLTTVPSSIALTICAARMSAPGRRFAAAAKSSLRLARMTARAGWRHLATWERCKIVAFLAPRRRLYEILCPDVFSYVIGKRSSNMIANWLFTACHSRTDRFHSCDVAFSAR